MNTDHISMLEAMGRAVGPDNASPGPPGYSIDGTSPAVVVRPGSVAELSGAMAAAWEDEMAVAPVGGRTRTDLGNRLRRLDAVLELTRLDRVITHNPADLTLTVEAGITLTSLQGELARHGQFLAVDPPLPDHATIGGTLTTGTSGPLKWQYGHPRDLVIGMKVVQADGTVISSGGRVVKNVSGYDMARLHIGGLGTLGVIAEVSFKLTPLPKQESTLLVAFEGSGPCLRAAEGIFHSHVIPLALCSFDRGVSERAESVDARGSHFLAVRAGGRPMTVRRQISDCTEVCRQHDATAVEVLDEAEAAALWRRLADFGWADEPRPAMIGRATLLPSAIPKLVEVIDRWDGARPTIVAQPAYGTVLMRWSGGDGGMPSEESVRVLSRARNAVHEAGGGMLIERCPVEVKDDFDVWDEVGESLATMRRMKEQYDPRGILNPGRFAGRI